MTRAPPVFIDGLDTCELESQTSLDIEEVGSFSGSDEKLIMKVWQATDATVEAIKELDSLFEFDTAKIYVGKKGDLMVVLYIGSDSPPLSVSDVSIICDRIPDVIRFMPTNGMGKEEGFVWCGSSHVADSQARKLL